MSAIRRSHQPQIAPFPPDTHPSSRIHTPTRTISAPIHLPSTSLPVPHSAPLDHAGRSRPDLRIITSFPTPHRRRPAHIVHPDISSTKIYHPRPVRHPSVSLTSSLSISRRKPIPALHVSVDTDQPDTFLSAAMEPPVLRTSHSLEKRMNREAAIISRDMYTSYHPSRSDCYHWKDEESGSPHIIPPTERRSGRGHKRTLSDKFKSLFSPSPSKALSATLLDDRKDQGRMCETAVIEVEEIPERIGVYDESDLPTLSAIYPQPDEAEDLIRGRIDENDRDAMLGVTEGPDRPYRSPGTASFLVHRMDRNAEEAGDKVQKRETKATRRNTFGVEDTRAGHACASSLSGSEESNMSSGQGEADDEMSSSE